MAEGAIKSAPTTASNNVPQNEGGVKGKFSLKEYSEEERAQHEKDAISHFGKPFRWNETGYLTPNGTKLDFFQYGSTFLIQRFDRNGSARVHFASAMTMLGKTDGASAADGSSYLELVLHQVQRSGRAVEADRVQYDCFQYR